MELNPDIIDLYAHLHEQHPGQAQGVGWTDSQSAYRCYAAATAVEEYLRVDPVMRTWLDVGCGYGGLGVFLKDYKRLPWANYVGIDANEQVIAAAQDHLPMATLDHVAFEDIANSKEESFWRRDIVVGIGLLSWYDPFEAIQIIAEMWKLANEAVVIVWNKDTSDVASGRELGPQIGCDRWVERHDFSPQHGALYLLKPDA